MPEYRLRRLINGQLGYRNFNAFLNGYRIEEARAALADPSQAEVPVTTIALDAGFQSIGPFNRAFKVSTGVTPTEYPSRRGWPARCRKSLARLRYFENWRSSFEFAPRRFSKSASGLRRHRLPVPPRAGSA